MNVKLSCFAVDKYRFDDYTSNNDLEYWISISEKNRVQVNTLQSKMEKCLRR